MFTHLLIGSLLGYQLFSSFRWEYFAFAGFMAFFPDLDVLLESSKKVRSSSLLAHKGISHSFFSALIVSTIPGLFFSLMYNENFFTSWFIAFLFYSLHVILDFMAASKIPLLYPFTKKRYRFFIDRAINPFLSVISGLSGLFLLIIRNSPRSMINPLTISLLWFYFVYFSYKTITKLWYKIKLPRNHLYIPGILPFVYMVYEKNEFNNKKSFKLTKKYHFSNKENKIIQTEIENNSIEQEFFQKALKLGENYTFFLKWEGLIPIILENKNEIKVMLFLAESYARQSAYSLRVDFDKNSGEVIEISDQFHYNLLKAYIE